MKACPFCGGEAKTIITMAGAHEGASYTATALCTNCGAEMHAMYYFPPHMKDPRRQTRLEIERRWNRRAKRADEPVGS